MDGHLQQKTAPSHPSHTGVINKDALASQVLTNYTSQKYQARNLTDTSIENQMNNNNNPNSKKYKK